MCILMVEDEALIVEIMSETLTEAGYHVMTAGSGPEALGLIADHHATMTGLLSDYHLPGGLTGLDVASAVRALRPDLPVVLATGRPDMLESHRRWHPGYLLLRKPYGPSDLLRMLTPVVSPVRLRTT